MDKQTILRIVAVLCLTILGVFAYFYKPAAPELLYPIVMAIGGLLGYSLGVSRKSKGE